MAGYWSPFSGYVRRLLGLLVSWLRSPLTVGAAPSAAAKTSLDWLVLLSVEHTELLTGPAESANHGAGLMRGQRAN